VIAYRTRHCLPVFSALSVRRRTMAGPKRVSAMNAVDDGMLYARVADFAALSASRLTLQRAQAGRNCQCSRVPQVDGVAKRRAVCPASLGSICADGFRLRLWRALLVLVDHVFDGDAHLFIG